MKLMTLNQKKMSLKKLLQTRLTEQFKSAKIEGAGPLSPRNGYYFIKDVNHEKIREKGTFPIGTVLWKLKEKDQFLKDVSFEISLSSLRIGDAFDYVNLSNKILFIDNVQLVLTSNLANPIRVECEYQVINKKPHFTTCQSMILSSYMVNATSFAEANSNYENNLGIDLSDAIYFEASSLDAYDAQIDDDDAYDAPTNKD
jgi:hypothetical protein